ncbi:MAG: hypothetical protein OEY69_00020 [Candidatus Krumholzibacteria bacterium]|nr:hypothetical protein [Candidatus Krumholzibacteria bacterium]
MAKSSPTRKALKELFDQGYLPEVVEKRLPIPGKFVTRDLFNVIDILAIKPGHPVLALQVTTRDHVNHRMTKTVEKGTALTWVQTNNRFEVWGYSPTGKRTVRMLPTGNWLEIKEAEDDGG